MDCAITGCPGEYEIRKIAHLERWDGQAVVIDHVPAEVCAVCGDVLFAPETVRRLELLRRTPPAPVSAVPEYEFGSV